MKAGSVMYRSRNGQIPAAKRVVIPKNRADGRRFERHGNRSLRGPESKSARRVARSKMKRERASPGRTSDSAALSTAEVRAKRALGNNFKNASFLLIMLARSNC